MARRDPLETAKQKGRAARSNNQSLDDCPYEDKRTAKGQVTWARSYLRARKQYDAKQTTSSTHDNEPEADMKIRTYDILEGRDSAVEHRRGTIAVFGDGFDRIEISVDQRGLRISGGDHAINIEPIAANCVYIKAVR